MALIDGLISYWKLDESVGETVDAHGDNDGDASAGVDQGAAGKINTGYEFHANDWVDMHTPASLNPSYMSISAWVKTSSTGSIIQIYTKDSTVAETERSWQFRKTDGEKLQFIVFKADEDYAVATSTTSISDGDWHHCVGTYDGSNAKVYVDSDLEDTEPLSGVIQTQSNEIYIGLSETSTPGYWIGFIDEIGVWDRALLQSEVTALYNSGNGFAYPFTVAGWVSGGKVKNII